MLRDTQEFVESIPFPETREYVSAISCISGCTGHRGGLELLMTRRCAFRCARSSPLRLYPALSHANAILLAASHYSGPV